MLSLLSVMLDVPTHRYFMLVKNTENTLGGLTMLVIGQSVKIEYVGGLAPDDIHNDLKAWWVRDYNAIIVSIEHDHIVVKDTDASDELVDCIYQIWSSDNTVKIIPLNE